MRLPKTPRFPRLAAPPRPADVAAVALAALAVLFAAGGAAHAAEEIDRIVLRVNDEILTLHDYEERKEAEIRGILGNSQISTTERQERLGQVGQFMLQQVFREMLLLSRAKQMGVRVDEAQVEQGIDRIVSDQGMGSRQELEVALASAGMTLADLRSNLQREQQWSQVIGREVTAQIEVGEEELRAIYRNQPEDFKVAEERQLQEVIVLDSSDLGEAERAEVAAAIVAALERGKTLAEAVAPHEERGVATGVIDLGWLERGELEGEIAEVAWSLPPGSFSQPVPARGGLHVVQVTGLKEGTVRPFSEVQDFILARERSRRFDRELETYLARLAERSWVQEDLPPDAVGYRDWGGGLVGEDELEIFRRPIADLAPTDTTPAAEEEAIEETLEGVGGGDDG